MKFIETITIWSNDVLVPIDRIKYINFSCTDNGGYKIKILTDDGEWEECFSDKEHKKAQMRYLMVKRIVEAE